MRTRLLIAMYVNIAAYKFITLDNLEKLHPQYQAPCNELGLEGTVLLTLEGINMFVSGTRAHCAARSQPA